MVIPMDGKSLSKELISSHHWSSTVRQPCLAIITVGDNEASKVYVKNKLRACEECNIKVIHDIFPETVEYFKVKLRILELNNDTTVDGIIVQQPLPKHLIGIEQNVIFDKDVDGFTMYNLGATLYKKNHLFNACTPEGIMYLLNKYEVPLCGKHVVILGRSCIVGKPLIGLLLNADCTVTSCNSKTENLPWITKQADILISAIGKPKFIDRNYLDSRCYCVIDVGINRDSNGKLCGDVDYEDILSYWNNLDVFPKRYITPVPGGVGPMTVSMLIHNLMSAYACNIMKLLGGNIEC